MSIDRRSFLKQGGLTVAALGLAGGPLVIPPGQARAMGAEFKVLSGSEVAALDAVAEVLLPGAAEAGVAHFIDDQLAKDPNEALLMGRFLQVAPPYARFYQGSLAALDGYCESSQGKVFADLDEETQRQVVGSLFRLTEHGNPVDPEGWLGPPAALVYLCLRSDAVDVVYGTQAGFKALNIPYMAHIVPPMEW